MLHAQAGEEADTTWCSGTGAVCRLAITGEARDEVMGRAEI